MFMWLEKMMGNSWVVKPKMIKRFNKENQIYAMYTKRQYIESRS